MAPSILVLVFITTAFQVIHGQVDGPIRETVYGLIQGSNKNNNQGKDILTFDNIYVKLYFAIGLYI